MIQIRFNLAVVRHPLAYQIYAKGWDFSGCGSSISATRNISSSDSMALPLPLFLYRSSFTALPLPLFPSRI
jgi:hypothetical protein